MAVNKMVFGSHQIDLTGDDVAKADVLAGKTIHLPNGVIEQGIMPNNGTIGGSISTKNGSVIVPAGFTNGGTIGISATEADKITPGNIRNGVSILGVTGTYMGYRVVTGTYSGTKTTKSFTISGFSFQPSNVIVVAFAPNGVSSASSTYMLSASTVPVVNPATGSNVYATRYAACSQIILPLTGKPITINSDGFTCTRASDYFPFTYLYVAWG